MDERVQTATDEELAAAIAANPRDELCAELFRRYGKRVYFWCYSHAHDADEAIGLAQETLEEIMWSIGGFAGGSSFSTWVYQIIRSRCRGEISKLRAQWRARLHAFEGEFVDALEPGFYEWVDGTCNCDRILESASGAMGREELQAFVLHYCDGLALKEIAKMLGCRSAAAASALIQNALRTYRDLAPAETACGCGAKSGGHESIEAIAALLEGRSSGRDPDAVREHIGRCALCDLEMKRLERFIGVQSDEEFARAAEWLYARGKLELAYAERIAPVVGKSGRDGEAPRFRLRRPLLLVPAAIVAVAIVLVGRFAARDESAPPAPERELARGAAIAAYEIELRSPEGDVGGFPAEFSWERARPDDRYALEIFSPSLERVYRADGIAAPPFAAPDSLRTILKPNVIYLWRVTGREGLEPAALSPFGWFRYRR